MTLLASAHICAAQPAAVSGVVRDSAGTAQLGVLVQLLTPDATVVGRAFTDIRGHYLVSNILPGSYRVQATVALFAPALKPNVTLRAGARTVVNLTMTTLFDSTSWLPAERRKADEPSDDWTWTLRSAANRPILRMVGDDGDLVMVSSSATESHQPSVRGRAAFTSNDGEFGGGGIHNVLTMDRREQDGSNVVLRADTGTGRVQNGIAPSTTLAAGYERQMGFASTTRTVASFQSHPELIGAGGTAGMQASELASAQRMKLGDLVDVEAGGVVYAVHTAGYALSAQPFLRVMVEPTPGWIFGYRMATSREMQSYSGMDEVQPETPVAATVAGKIRLERGRHQEVLVARRLGHGEVQLALYKDALESVALAGVGDVGAADLGALSAVANTGGVSDALTGSFRMLTAGYQAEGVNMRLTQPLTSTASVAVEYSTGRALSGNGAVTSLADTMKGLKLMKGQSAAVALKGSVPGTGTKIRAVYRWQPHNLLTAVDPYREFGDQAFLSVHLRQPFRWEGVLPPGLEASVDITNLLAQGYQPFLSADGQTLYLAQSPRVLQAGLSINF